ncbi:MAG: sialate O-acetylesterase, partial [Cyclobacteriaceae bacterium]
MKRSTIIVCQFLHLLVLLPSIAVAQKDLDLFIWSGQSNAQGWMGDAANYPEEGIELDDSILLNWTFVDNQSSGGKWVKMQAQDGRFPKGHFGPEVSFGRELKKAGYNPAIFKYTKGATGLAHDWKSPGDGGIYDRMTEDLRLAIKNLERKGFNVKLRAFIWIQGETDAGNENTAGEYYANLKKMIHDLRHNVIIEPHLKIILGVDEQHQYVKERPVVVQAQKKLAAEDTTIVFTSMIGLSKADATHLTPEGLVAHGKRIFDGYSSKNLGFLNSSKSLVKTFPGEKTVWKGFVRYNFEFEGRNSHVTVPQKSLRGKPWVWRARFPNWHTEMDSLLLSEGFHVAYVDTDNMYGSPAAVAVW